MSYLEEGHGSSLVRLSDRLLADQIRIRGGDGGDPGLNLRLLFFFLKRGQRSRMGHSKQAFLKSGEPPHFAPLTRCCTWCSCGTWQQGRCRTGLRPPAARRRSEL